MESAVSCSPLEDERYFCQVQVSMTWIYLYLSKMQVSQVHIKSHLQTCSKVKGRALPACSVPSIHILGRHQQPHLVIRLNQIKQNELLYWIVELIYELKFNWINEMYTVFPAFTIAFLETCLCLMNIVVLYWMRHNTNRPWWCSPVRHPHACKPQRGLSMGHHEKLRWSPHPDSFAQPSSSPL